MRVLPGGQSTRERGDARQTFNHHQTLFVENRGQWDRQVKFLLRSSGVDMWITDHGVLYDLFKLTPVQDGTLEHSAAGETTGMMREGQVVDISFEGTSFAPRARGMKQQSGAYNYFIGNDRSKWASGVRRFTEARIDNLYDGIDVVFYLDNGQPRYDLIIAAGGDPSEVNMKIAGSNGVRVNADGSLAIATSMGLLHQGGLYAYQDIDGRRQEVACHFVVRNDGRVGFEVGSYDRKRMLVIDPLVYSTYLGGNGGDIGQGIAADGNGNAYITGYTFSTNFPVVHQYHDYQLYADVFVTKLAERYDDSVQLVYSTFIGGDSTDWGNSIAVDQSGTAYIAGQTVSSDFPMQNPYQSALSIEDAFVVKLHQSSDGSVSLDYSTYLGGRWNDIANAIAIDDDGNAYVTGQTVSEDFPTLHEFQGDQTGGDVFVTKLAYGGTGNVSLVYSTYLGGNISEQGLGIAVDVHGDCHVTGWTTSSDFPTINQVQEDQLSQDIFATKLRYSGSGDVTVLYSTYLGGRGLEQGTGIAVDGNGNTYVTGQTGSDDLPLLKQYQNDQPGEDAFIVGLAQADNGDLSFVFCTYLGGNERDEGKSIAIDGSGVMYVAGMAGSTDFPLLDQYQTDQLYPDAFVTKLIKDDNDSISLVSSTLLGGDAYDEATGIAVDANSNMYVAGTTSSTDFPTVNEVLTYPSQSASRYHTFACKFGNYDSVEFLNYELTALERRVTLKWRTASEMNNAGFEVQRSSDSDATFRTIAYYLTHQELAGLGTSSVGRGYQWIDDLPSPGNYHYRIVSISTAGIRTIHQVQSVLFATPPAGRVEEIGFRLLNMGWPYSTGDEIRISYRLPGAMAVRVDIYAEDGRLMDVPVNDVVRGPGSYSQSISVAGWSSGSYLLRLQAGDSMFVQRFAVVH